MNSVADEIGEAGAAELIAQLAEVYNADYAPARRRLIEFCRKVYRSPPEGLDEQRRADCDRNIRAGYVWLGQEPFDPPAPVPPAPVPPVPPVPNTQPERNDAVNKRLVEMDKDELDAKFAKLKTDSQTSMARADEALAAVGKRNGRKEDGPSPAATEDLHVSRAKRNGHVAPAPSPPASAPPSPAAQDEVRMIAVNQIVQSTFNPRRDFNEANLKTLASQLESQGQLQNLVVRPHTLTGCYEIVDGERRWRAAQLLGWKELRCLIKSIDLATACLDAMIANVGAQSLNAIEEAIGYKQVLEAPGGPTYTALAKLVGLSQSEVSNRIRLLDLPEEWKARVISREMSKTHARDLTTWSHRPAVLNEVARMLKQQHEKPNDVTLAEFQKIIRRAAHAVSRPVEGHFNFYDARGNWRNGEVLFKPTAEELQQLDVEEVRHGRGRDGVTSLAFNVALWEELQKKAAEAATERHAKQLERMNKAGKAGKSKTTPAAEKARVEKLDRQYQQRLDKWKIRFLQERIADRVEKIDAPMASRLVLFFAFQQNNLRARGDDDGSLLEQLVVAHKGKPAVNQKYAGFSDFDYWRTIESIPDAGVRHVANGLLKVWLCHDTQSFQADITADDVEAIAATLGVDLSKEWKLTRDFLELHTTDQLRDLMKEWKLPLGFQTAKLKRKDMIDVIVEHGAHGVNCPARLVPAKGKKKGGKR